MKNKENLHNKMLLPLGYDFSMMTKLFYGAMGKHMETFDLERYYSFLLIIAQSDHDQTQQCLCKMMHIDKVSMVKIIDHLCDRGYVVRVPNPADRRQNLLKLTEKAVAELPAIKQKVEEMNNNTMKGLSPDEQTHFLHMMHQVVQNLQELPAYPMSLQVNKK